MSYIQALKLKLFTYRPQLWKMIQRDNNFEAESLSYADRVILLRENPVLACRSFKSRIENIIRYIWDGASKPLGDLIDYWVRIEFQVTP